MRNAYDRCRRRRCRRKCENRLTGTLGCRGTAISTSPNRCTQRHLSTLVRTDEGTGIQGRVAKTSKTMIRMHHPGSRAIRVLCTPPRSRWRPNRCHIRCPTFHRFAPPGDQTRGTTTHWRRAGRLKCKDCRIIPDGSVYELEGRWQEHGVEGEGISLTHTHTHTTTPARVCGPVRAHRGRAQPLLRNHAVMRQRPTRVW